MDKGKLRLAEKLLDDRFAPDRRWQRIIPLRCFRTDLDCSDGIQRARVKRTGRLLEQTDGETGEQFEQRFIQACRDDRSLLVEVAI